MGGEDPQKHLHPLLDLIDSAEAFIHPCFYPGWDWLALFLIPMTLRSDALDLFLSDLLHAPLQRHERGAGW